MSCVSRLGSLLSSRKLVWSCVAEMHQARGLATSCKLMDMFYTAKHEWVKVEGTAGTIGVSAYAADALGDVVYAQLPDAGDSFSVGEVGGHHHVHS